MDGAINQPWIQAVLEPELVFFLVRIEVRDLVPI